MKRAPGSYAGLTFSQAELLSFLRYQQAAGVSPSFDEMVEALGLASKSGVHRLVVALEERGYIRRLPNRHRSIEVLERRVEASADDAPTLRNLARYTLSDLLAEMKRRGIDVRLVA